MFRSRWALFVALALLACGDDGSAPVDDSSSTNSGIDVYVSMDHRPDVNETATISCLYEVDYPTQPLGRSDYIVNGHFVIPSSRFRVVSGDSSWVDTVLVNTRRTHSVTVRATKAGEAFIDVFATSVIEEGYTVISGAASIFVRVE
jgi:hypothetical protein